ncbi:hypothetical protein CPB84DRAFT_1674115 [Gymnopilus junonius]|uniref:FHA domain-containing protein n=1 Tax=Gymnopilus junonius TaxID=109634 RepID=A0A9P5TS36_GYMJU|nr:hypothetical protein CPB84DRAFT_1674115 [Gymnopilus junonius]
MSSPVITLSPVSGSFPFETKMIPLPSGTKIALGYEMPNGPARLPSTTNGWFAPQQTEDTAIDAVFPLPLSFLHAELWCDGGKVFIRDLKAPFGTLVNGTTITEDTVLKQGDVVGLGKKVPREDKTPVYLTDLHLCAVTAEVSISGLSS